MDRGISCNIHKNYPTFHISILEKDTTRLKCVKCISNKRMEMDFILLQEIIENERNTFFENWPPLSNCILRKDIIELNQEDRDLNKPIEEFYDTLTQEIIKIISEKKKQQLMQAQKVYELKSMIIQQYQKMASIDKIKECLVQENQQIEKIEQDLIEKIESQYKKKEEYTSKLSFMMKEYQLISKLDIQKSDQIKQNILEILQVINLLPQNNFQFGDDTDVFGLNNFDAFKQKVKEELENSKKYQIKLDNLISLLNICNNQLIQKIHEKDWFLDDFLTQQQTFLLDIQINQAGLFKDIYQNAHELKNLIAKNIQKLGQPSFKYFSEFNNNLKLQDGNAFIFSKNSNEFIKANEISRLLVQRVKTGFYNVQCFLNFTFNPKKKYLFRMNFQKTKLSSTFYVGLISVNNIHNKDLDEEGLGFIIGSQQKKQNPLGLFQSNNQRLFMQTITYSSIIDLNQESNQANNLEQDMVFTLYLRVCLEDKLIQYQNYNNKSQIFELQNKDQIKVDGKYHLGLSFYSYFVGDQIEIQDYQELDQFPK